jgi:hypothetical protein
MKRISLFLFFSIILMLLQTNAFATIRRVNFVQSVSPVAGIDFANFQAAHDAAVNGDTIQLYPNTANFYTSGTISKKLVILGSGYFYNSYTTYADISNAGLQLIPGGINNGYRNSFTISTGSAGTVFQGVNGLGITTIDIADSLNSITVSRCRYVDIFFTNSGVCNNWLITQCYDVNVRQDGYAATYTGNRTITNLRIENTFNPVVSYNASGRQSPVGVNSGQFLNCIIGQSYSYLNNSVFIVQNCIDALGYLGSNYYWSGLTNTIFINNLTTASATNNPIFTNPGSSGNIFNMATGSNSVFVGYPNNTSGSTTLYSSDAKWQLSTNSIAKGAGIIPGTTTATDCGMYGGTNPYKASGIPAVPAFYKLNAPSATAITSPYVLTFSVRGNN